MTKRSAYSFSFTAASLRPELVTILVKHFSRLGSWDEAKNAVLATNALQARSSASSVRMEREIRQRMKALTPEQLKLVSTSTADVRTCIAWLGAVKHSAFLFEFPAEVMRSKWDLRDAVLRVSDYERFINEKTPHHSELAKLTASSAAKIRRVLLLMLREVGLLVAGSDLGTIQRPFLPPSVENVIRADEPRWLAAFLFSDDEIGTHKARRS